MRILVTNDDGIRAPGLAILRRIAEELSSDVWVVAPETNQSGVSHSLTLYEPLRCRAVSERTYAVRGTPTDCVIMGVRHLLAEEPPTLVLSGVNHGANLAEDVSYSGTIAGAIEGTLLGIRSIAMSLTTGFDPDERIHWQTALDHGPRLVTRLLDTGWPDSVLINVNYPDLAPDKVSGIEVAMQGRRDQALDVEERTDPWGQPYFWFRSGRRLSDPPEGTDLSAIQRGYISVTPLYLNLTHQATCAALALALGGSDRPEATAPRRADASGKGVRR